MHALHAWNYANLLKAFSWSRIKNNFKEILLRDRIFSIHIQEGTVTATNIVALQKTNDASYDDKQFVYQ